MIWPGVGWLGSSMTSRLSSRISPARRLSPRVSRAMLRRVSRGWTLWIGRAGTIGRPRCRDEVARPGATGGDRCSLNGSATGRASSTSEGRPAAVPDQASSRAPRPTAGQSGIGGRPGREDQRSFDRLGGRDPDRLADPELLRRRDLLAVGLPERLVESARSVVPPRDGPEVLAAPDDVRHGLDEVPTPGSATPARATAGAGVPAPARALPRSLAVRGIREPTHPPCPATAPASAKGFAVGAFAMIGSNVAGAVARFGTSLVRFGPPPDGRETIGAGCRRWRWCLVAFSSGPVRWFAGESGWGWPAGAGDRDELRA